MSRRLVISMAVACAVTAAVTAGPSHAGDSGHGGGHWAYSGANGPSAWGGLDPAFEACGRGRSQSPIDIRTPESAEMLPITFQYTVAPLEIVNNGHTVQVNYAEGSTITVGDRTFRLIQYHFHTPSEHQVDGRTFPMEIHFVHKNDVGELAVVGVLIEPGEANLAAQEVWRHLPTHDHGKQTHPSVLVNARDLMPESKAYYRYMGSLTTPPCSEGVNWFVLKTPIQFSHQQIATIEAVMGHNARPPQLRHDRIVLGGQGAR